MTPGLDHIVAAVRAHAGVTGKAPIAAIARYLPVDDPVHGPGDDGAIVEIGDEQIVACGEALFPPFVANDPYGAGVAAVLANVNDVAAMGGVPVGIVNTVVAAEDVADEAMRGMRDASVMYDVPILGGHLTRHAGPPALSAFAVGRAERVLSMANVRPGQSLLLACSLDGHMRADFPFFTSIERQAHRLDSDIRLLAQVAAGGMAEAAKDVSMPGPLGSLAMLLEFRGCGALIDLEAVPAPADTDLARWLVSFPTYAFWLAAEPDRAADCVGLFEAEGLTCAVAGQVTGDGAITLTAAGERRQLLDWGTDSITGLWRSHE